MCHKGPDCNAGMQSIERILRQLLTLPQAPAVVFVHASPYWTMEMAKGWSSKKKSSKGKRNKRNKVDLKPVITSLDEDDLAFEFHRQWGHETHEHLIDELAKYYALPSVSIRDVIWHEMKANTTFLGMTLPMIYYDRIHPSDLGHTILAQALVHLVKRTQLFYHMSPPENTCVATPPLYPPMQPSVTTAEGQGLECYGANEIASLVDQTACTGWQLQVEYTPSGVPKPGWIASNAGASCSFTYSSSSNASTHRIGIGFLKSYQRMGRVLLMCEHQCRCNAQVLDAHHVQKISPLDLVYISVTMDPVNSM